MCEFDSFSKIACIKKKHNFPDYVNLEKNLREFLNPKVNGGPLFSVLQFGLGSFSCYNIKRYIRIQAPFLVIILG